MDEAFKKIIRKQLSDMVGSSDFMASQRMRDLLVYIVEKTLEGKGDDLKGYTIALDVFGMGSDFDPRINPLVRLEVARLRTRLDHYYLSNPGASVYIHIPKGKYIASFKRKELEESVTAELDTVFDKCGKTCRDYLSSILILPLACTTNTQQTIALAAGLQSELGSLLTKCREFRIIDCDNFLSPGIENNAIADIVKKSKARFLLKGNAQTSKNQYKVWVTLIDSYNNYNVWSETFRGSFDKEPIFQISENIAAAIAHHITDKFGQIGRILYNEYASGQFDSSVTQEAYILHWRWTILYSRKHLVEALKSVERAAKADPSHITTQAILADLYASDWEGSYNLVPDSLNKSIQIASQAVVSDPECQLAHLAMALNHFLRADEKKLVAAGEEALRLNSCNTNVLVSLSHWYGLMGRWGDSLALQEKLREVQPAYPGFRHAILAIYNYLHGNFEEALMEVDSFNAPGVIWDPLVRLLSNIRLQRVKETEAALKGVRQIYPEFLESGLTILSRYIPNRDYLARVCDELKKGGIVFKKQKIL